MGHAENNHEQVLDIMIMMNKGKAAVACCLEAVVVEIGVAIWTSKGK